MSIKNINLADSIGLMDTMVISNPDQQLAYENLSDSDLVKHVFKTGAKGFVKTTIFKGNTPREISGTPNLVLLSGREFLAQKLADIPQSIDVDQRAFRIRYFGYGRGGAQEGTGTVPNKMGPFDDDAGLYAPGNFATGSSDANSRFKYIHDGKLKNIRTDNGTITIEKEEHVINKGSISAGTGTSTSTETIVQRFTAIKYTMFIMSHEFIKPSTAGAVDENPFPFNEAALYAVDTKLVLNEDGVTYMEQPAGESTIEQQNAQYIPFARFTTSTKWIEEGESLKIEWYILV